MISATVIVPVHNACTGQQGDSWLLRLFHSLQYQTFKNWEALFINDGSSDNSIQTLRHFAEADPRVKVIDKANEGVAKTRNLGISLATGDYVFFIDQDDYLDPDYLEVFLKEANLSNAKIVIGGYRRIDDAGNEIFRIDTVPDSQFSKWCLTPPWARVFKTSFLKENSLEFLDNNIGEDLYFNACAYAKASNNDILLTKYNGYIWFYNRTSVSNTKQKGLSESINVKSLLVSLSQIAVPETEQSYFSQFMARYAVWYLLYCGRDASPKTFASNSEDLMAWTKCNGYRPRFHFWDKRIACESLTNRMAVSSYYAIFSKPGFLTLFSKLYCRGN